MKKKLVSLFLVFAMLFVTGLGAVLASPAFSNSENDKVKTDVEQTQQKTEATQKETTVQKTEKESTEEKTTEKTDSKTTVETKKTQQKPEDIVIDGEQFNLDNANEISPFGILTGSSVVVENEQDLIDTINGTTETELIITLGDNFPSTVPSTIKATVQSGKNITIDGNGKTLFSPNTKHFVFNIKSGGNITVKNINIDGNSNKYGGITVNGGTATLQDVKIQNIQDDIGVISEWFEGTVNNLTVNNCFFNNIVRVDAGHGAGIFSRGSLKVNNSTFSNNKGTAYNGYAGGAIALFRNPENSILEVNNTYFQGNTAQKYGGAICLYQANGNVKINNSYFEGNKAIRGLSTWTDGGAIGIFNNGQAFNMSVKNSTFNGNSAVDDGGAIFVESNNASVKGILNVENSTFFNNNGGNLGGNGSGAYPASDGGAVQISLNVEATFKNNTFYKNSARTKNGGALGVHSDQYTPTYNLVNNLFIGNIGKADHSNVYGTVNTNVGNIGFDNGTALPAELTIENIFGNSDPVLAEYGIGISAGASGHTKALTTFYILPKINNVSGTSAYQAGGNGGTASDVRGKVRKSTPDAGAVEIQGYKFNANGGAWNGLSACSYPTGAYYSGTDNVLALYYATHQLHQLML